MGRRSKGISSEVQSSETTSSVMLSSAPSHVGGVATAPVADREHARAGRLGEPAGRVQKQHVPEVAAPALDAREPRHLVVRPGLDPRRHHHVVGAAPGAHADVDRLGRILRLLVRGQDEVGDRAHPVMPFDDEEGGADVQVVLALAQGPRDLEHGVLELVVRRLPGDVQERCGAVEALEVAPQQHERELVRRAASTPSALRRR